VNLNLDPAGDDVREIEGSRTAFRYVGSGGGEVWISSDRGRPVWVEAYLNGGRTEARGNLPSVGWWATGAIVSVRPHSRLETRVDASYEHSRWPARWVEERAPGTHLFAELSAPDRLADRLALKTLLMPGGLGSTHTVMVFAKR